MRTAKANVIVGLLFGVLSCAPREFNSFEQGKPPTKHAVEYRVLQVDDTSFLGRVRKSARIFAPDATSLEERAETTLQAAIDLQERWDADAVGVFLSVSTNKALQERGYPLAIASYAPDGGGWSGDNPFRNVTWEAEATNVVLSGRDVEIAEMWYENRDRFQVDDGYGGTETDENALENYLASELSISPSKVSLLPLLEIITSRKPYNLEE